MKISILIFDGVDEIDFVGPFEVFRHAVLLGKDADISLETIDLKSEIITQHGLKIIPDGVLASPADVFVIPGGGWVNRSANGIRHEIAKGLLVEQILSFYNSGAILCGVCTGVMALAAAGVLKNCTATTHHGALDDLRQYAEKVLKARVVDHGRIITCGGVTSSIDLSLWMVQRFWGKETAEAIADYLEFERDRHTTIIKD
jgi:transcriptional regulator GlxA family with amidase domain